MKIERTALRMAKGIVRLIADGAPRAASLGLFLTLLSGLMPPISAFVVKSLIDQLNSAEAGSGAYWLAAASAALAALAAVTAFAAAYLVNRTQQQVTRLAESRLFSAVNAFHGLRYFEDHAFHQRIAIAERAVESTPTDVILLIAITVRQGTTLLGFMGILVTVWIPMAGLLLLSAICAVAMQVLLARQSARFVDVSMLGQRWRLYFRAKLTQSASAREARLFGFAGMFQRRMEAALDRSLSFEDAQNRRTTLTELTFALLNAFVVTAGALEVVRGVESRRITVGGAVLFLAAVTTAQSSLNSVIGQFGRAKAALLLFEHFEAVRSMPSDIRDGDRRAEALQSGIAFNDVWFRYSPHAPWVFEGLTFHMPIGNSVGVVGLNGAGKSTLVKLLMRLYDPSQGTITWDGTDLREFQVESLRSLMSATFQDFCIFDLTARENITLGGRCTELSDHSAQAAAKATFVHEAIEGLPRGYETLISRELPDAEAIAGAALSGGQLQRLALARAAIRQEPSVLVLDEPSSGLDAESELAIFESLTAAGRQGVVLLISHRLNAMRHMDSILVLRGGVVNEQGSHSLLLKRGGEYARLFELQASGYLE